MNNEEFTQQYINDILMKRAMYGGAKRVCASKKYIRACYSGGPKRCRKYRSVKTGKIINPRKKVCPSKSSKRKSKTKSKKK